MVGGGGGRGGRGGAKNWVNEVIPQQSPNVGHGAVKEQVKKLNHIY